MSFWDTADGKRALEARRMDREPVYEAMRTPRTAEQIAWGEGYGLGLADGRAEAAAAKAEPLDVPITAIGEVLAHSVRAERIREEDHYICGLCEVDITRSNAFHEKGCEYAIVRRWLADQPAPPAGDRE